ncbi:serine/threonine-protein phosphatase 6 regulatory subunit 2 isoform 6-T9 [Alca torda]
MFWKFDLNTTSHVDKLLDKEDVTLHELMDEDDILQECKAQNRKLLDFLCQQHCMEELVNLITHEPPVDMDEKVRFKYPNTACELLTSDVPQINDKLGGDETLLNILYDFLDHEPPLNPLLASFFSKTIGNLIARKTEQVIAFLRRKDKFISLVLKHIDTSAMMDLLLRLISCVEPATLRQEVLNWLNEAKIIQRLVELIHSSQDEDRQSNASQTLCDIIRLSRDQSNQLQDIPEPDPLLTALESAEGGMRRGNMGHLTRIANAVVQNMEKGPMQTQISEFIKELPEDCRGRWESFVEETLTETNRRNTVDLVSTHHLHSSSEDEDIESAFPNELSLQQAFSEYQIQQMTANFVDQFGFNDEEFADQDDNINAPFDRIAEINFNIDADDDSPNASLFEACCNERIQQFDDNEEEEDIWEEKEITYATQVKSRTRFGASQTSESSSKSDLENGDHDGSVDSEEEEETEQQPPPSSANTTKNNVSEQKDSDSSEGAGWTAVFEPVSSKPPAPCVAMDVGSSVWDSAAPENAAPEEKGWAKFTDFQPFCCSESGPRCSSPVDTESNDSAGNTKQSQDKNFSTASPCVWNVCVTRKAPLVASDSSSSGGSDSEEEEEKADTVTETISTGSGQETIKLTVDAKNEKAVFTSDADCMVIDKLTIADMGTTKASKPLNNVAQHSEEHQNTAAVTAVTETATKDRKEEVLPCAEATLNGPA